MKTTIFLMLAVIVISCSSGEKNCTITGEITGRKTDALLLFKASQFPVYEAEIPIRNNSFTYSFKFRHPEVYLLIFRDEFKKGTMRETPFFSEAGKIKFTIPADRDNSGYVVKGHDLNDALIMYYKELKIKFYDEAMKYGDSIGLMYKNKSVYTKQYQELEDALEKTTNKAERNQLIGEQKFLMNIGSMYSPKAKKLAKMQDSILKSQSVWEAAYVDKNTSFISLYLFLNRVRDIAGSNTGRQVDAPSLRRVQSNLERHSIAFPGHPYCRIIKNSLEGFRNAYVGGQIADFTAANIQGDSTTVSGVIKSNKATLLNFWTPWSTPTVQMSKDLIPVYNAFKDKGFGVIGISQSFTTTDDPATVAKKENHPWMTIIDKDNKAGAWEKYNLSWQSGGMFLVDSSGKILAINLSPDKLKEKLTEVLK